MRQVLSSEEFERFAASADPRYASGSEQERLRALLVDNDAMRAELLLMKARCEDVTRQMAEALRAIDSAKRMADQAEAVTNSTLWRVMAPVRKAMHRVPRPLRSAARKMAGQTLRALRRAQSGSGQEVANSSTENRLTKFGPADDEAHFREWLAAKAAEPKSVRSSLLRRAEALPFKPLISIVMPAYNTDANALERAIQSVRVQAYHHLELCIADDASSLPHVSRVIERHASQDSRIKWVRRDENGNISLATNAALDLATGEYVAFMDHDDVISEEALLEIASAINEDPEVLVLYSDEDRMNDKDRQRHSPFFKPDWDPDLILGHNYICHLMVMRRSLVETLGGMRKGMEGSQDHDMILRAANIVLPGRIRHVPHLLYHWTVEPRSFSSTALDRCVRASRQAVADHLATRADAAGAQVVAHPSLPDLHRVIWPLPDKLPLVSVLIPTRDRADLLRGVTSGLLHRTDYPNLEVLILDNGSIDRDALGLLDTLARDPRVRVLSMPGPFNYSRINNEGAKQARGDVLLLLNNDVLVMEPLWLREMVSHAIRPDVGTVGAKLFFADRTVQHGGVVLGVGEFAGGPGVAGHYALHEPIYSRGYFSQAVLTRTVSGNTAACLAVRKSVFDAAHGFNEEDLAVSFNDVDLCLRITKLGFRHVWTPFATLYHLESASRGHDSMLPEKLERAGREGRYMREKWGHVLDHDPFYNPNLSRQTPLYGIPIPPREVGRGGPSTFA